MSTINYPPLDDDWSDIIGEKFGDRQKRFSDFSAHVLFDHLLLKRYLLVFRKIYNRYFPVTLTLRAFIFRNIAPVEIIVRAIERKTMAGKRDGRAPADKTHARDVIARSLRQRSAFTRFSAQRCRRRRRRPRSVCNFTAAVRVARHARISCCSIFSRSPFTRFVRPLLASRSVYDFNLNPSLLPPGRFFTVQKWHCSTYGRQIIISTGRLFSFLL